ncbi:MAG: hypothetical protein KJ583_03975 [Nanoarchaeota archaeon]|nr:hypothetical protein [Nanoarchaeota archaeon]MBU1270144.1 hypothetical protein [Nanoarchaeota archaeon]MBU1604450.1 hypothetical protein [Nanoarchaeota archaeon]MBU2443802.1 hypothetical protein [Nanoarchaeota archaeon]
MNKNQLQFSVVLLTILFIVSFASAEIFEVNLINTEVVNQTVTSVQPPYEKTIFEVYLVSIPDSPSQQTIIYVPKQTPPTTIVTPTITTKPPIIPLKFGAATGDANLKVCSCSKLNDSIKIRNTENKKVAYSLSSNLDFVSINPSYFELESGAIQEVLLQINAPCNILDKTLKITVKLLGDGEATLTKKLVVSQCQNLDVKLKASKDDIDPCKSVEYELLIKNSGLFSEQYTATPITNKPYMTLSSQTILLNPGEEGIIKSTFTPSCAVFGVTPNIFSVVAENNRLKTEIKHDLVINKLYDYSLDIDDYHEVCEEEYAPIEFDIENDVDTPNKYYLELIGAPSFVKLSSNQVSLGSDESKSENINFILKQVKVGYYTFTLKSTSWYGNISNEKTVILDIIDCYKPKITIVDKNLRFCASEKELVVNVKNEGLYEEKISLKAYPAIAELDTDSIILEPGEDKDVVLTLNPPDKDATYGLLVEAVLKNGVKASDEVKNIVVLSQWSCYKASIAKTSYSIRRDTENSAVIKITNEGLESGKYSLSLQPKDFWIKLSEKTLSLNPGETKEILLLSNHTDKTPFGDYTLDLTIKSDNDFEYKNNIIVSLKDKPVYVKLYLYFSQKPCRFVTVLLIFAIIILAIVAKFVKKKGWLNKRKFILFLVLLLVILGILLWIVYFFIGPPVLNPLIDYSKASSTHYIWAQDKAFKVEKSSFVSDPDAGDKVNLSLIDSSEFVNVDITIDKVVFMPKQGWYGVTNVSFLAVDNHDAFTLSPRITLEVVRRDKFTLSQAYDKLCFYANWFLVFIAFIFVAIIGYKRIRMDFNERRAVARKKRS